MANPITFDEFLPVFFGIFTQRSFRGADFLAYLNRSDAQRSGDEASIVVLNQAFQRQHENQAKPPKPPSTLEGGYTPLSDALKPYVEKAFTWHQRQATLRQTYQQDIRVHDD